MQIITSKDNEIIKNVRKLKEKKYRDLNNEYIVEGVKMIKEAILEEAKINDVNATEFSDFSSTVVPLTNKLENIPADLTGYNFKVFLFDSEAGLKPLADMLVK